MYILITHYNLLILLGKTGAFEWHLYWIKKRCMPLFIPFIFINKAKFMFLLDWNDISGKKRTHTKNPQTNKQKTKTTQTYKPCKVTNSYTACLSKIHLHITFFLIKEISLLQRGKKVVKNDTARIKIIMCMKSRFFKMKTSSYAYRLH